jgi:glutamyl-Q tRNA(Asp) synthetase
VVVDDAEQHITEIVRGSDLLDNTPRQLYLQRVLKLDSPEYMHLPVAVDQRGIKLSKQTHAEPVDLKEAVPTLCRTLAFLGQKPPEELQDADLESFWAWAVQNWDASAIRRVMNIQETAI